MSFIFWVLAGRDIDGLPVPCLRRSGTISWEQALIFLCVAVHGAESLATTYKPPDFSALPCSASSALARITVRSLTP